MYMYIYMYMNMYTRRSRSGSTCRNFYRSVYRTESVFTREDPAPSKTSRVRPRRPIARLHAMLAHIDPSEEVLSR